LNLNNGGAIYLLGTTATTATVTMNNITIKFNVIIPAGGYLAGAQSASSITITNIVVIG